MGLISRVSSRTYRNSTMSLLDKFKNFHVGDLPSAESLAKLAPKDLLKIKARRDFDSEVAKLTFEEHLELVVKEAQKYTQAFPKATFYGLLNKIRSMEDIAMISESGITSFCDARFFMLKFLSEIKQLNQLVFALLTLLMESLVTDSSSIEFLNDATTAEIKAGGTQEALFKAWLNILAISVENEIVTQQVLKIFLLEILDKIGDHARRCLDAFLSLAKRKDDERPSKLLAICCMVHLLIKFKKIEYPALYQDVFDTLASVDLLDSKPEITCQFLASTELLLKSPFLANYMPAKLIRQMAMLAWRSSRGEGTSKVREILATMKRINPTCDAWTELQVDTDFNYKSKNYFSEGGASSVYPELVTLRSHIEPDIVLDAGCVLRGDVIESSGIVVDFDGIDPESVDCLHNKSNRDQPKALRCFD